MFLKLITYNYCKRVNANYIFTQIKKRLDIYCEYYRKHIILSNLLKFYIGDWKYA